MRVFVRRHIHRTNLRCAGVFAQSVHVGIRRSGQKCILACCGVRATRRCPVVRALPQAKRSGGVIVSHPSRCWVVHSTCGFHAFCFVVVPPYVDSGRVSRQTPANHRGRAATAIPSSGLFAAGFCADTRMACGHARGSKRFGNHKGHCPVTLLGYTHFPTLSRHQREICKKIAYTSSHTSNAAPRYGVSFSR